MTIRCRLYNPISKWRKKITRWSELRRLRRHLTQRWTPLPFPLETSDDDVSLLCGCCGLHYDNRFECNRLYFIFEELLSYGLSTSFCSVVFVLSPIHLFLHRYIRSEARGMYHQLSTQLHSSLHSSCSQDLYKYEF
jgi:hypothetical protein